MIKENSKVSTADMTNKFGISIATVKRKIKKIVNGGQADGAKLTSDKHGNIRYQVR